jgi:hypothetical protein
VPLGTIVSTNPWHGTDVWAGFQMSLVVSAGPADEGPASLPGLDDYLVCRILRASGDFGAAGDEVVVFEEERVPGAGCTSSEGFQHVAVTRDGVVTNMSPRITDIAGEAWKVWPYATPDLDDDGVDEIAIATPQVPGRYYVWFLSVSREGLKPLVNGEVPFRVVIGTATHENGAQTTQGVYCEGAGAAQRLVTWSTDADDPFLVSTVTWRLLGRAIERSSEGQYRVSGASDYPPTGDHVLCGTPVSEQTRVQRPERIRYNS